MMFLIALFFSITLRFDNVQDFVSGWDEFLLFMTQFSSDDVLENLCKLRTCEFEKIKTVLELRHGN